MTERTIAINVIVETVGDEKLTNEEMAEVRTCLMEQINWCLRDLDFISDRVQEILINAELAGLSVEMDKAT